VSSFAEMAEAMGIRHCRGIDPSGHYCHEEHRDGGTATDGVVHLVETATRRRFLYLAAVASEPDLATEPAWRRVYRIAMFQRHWASEFGVRIPVAIRRRDKAFVLASLVDVPASEPLRKEAFDWARR
jgi:hypothetical protein